MILVLLEQRLYKFVLIQLGGRCHLLQFTVTIDGGSSDSWQYEIWN